MTGLDDLMESKEFRDGEAERNIMKNGAGSDAGAEHREGWVGTKISSFEAPFDGKDDEGNDISPHNSSYNDNKPSLV